MTSNNNLNLKSQNATIEIRRGQHRKDLPYTFAPKQWIEKTNAFGFVSKAGRYGGTCGVAKCDTFIVASVQQVVLQLIQIPWEHKFAIFFKCGIMKQLATQIPWGHNIAINPMCGNLKEVKMA